MMRYLLTFVFLCYWMIDVDVVWYNDISLVLVGLSMMRYLTLLLVYHRMTDYVIQVTVTILMCWMNHSNEMFSNVIGVVYLMSDTQYSLKFV